MERSKIRKVMLSAPIPITEAEILLGIIVSCPKYFKKKKDDYLTNLRYQIKEILKSTFESFNSFCVNFSVGQRIALISAVYVEVCTTAKRDCQKKSAFSRIWGGDEETKQNEEIARPVIIGLCFSFFFIYVYFFVFCQKDCHGFCSQQFPISRILSKQVSFRSISQILHLLLHKKATPNQIYKDNSTSGNRMHFIMLHTQ